MYFILFDLKLFLLNQARKQFNEYMKWFVPEVDLGLLSKIQSTLAHIELAGLCPQLPRNKTATNKSACVNFESCIIYYQQQKLALGLTCYRVRQFWGDTSLKNDLTSFKQCCSAKLCCDIQLAVIRLQSQFGMYYKKGIS